MRYLTGFDGNLTAERVREILDYDPLTGVFRWAIRTSPAAAAGDVAGSLYAGYRRIRIAGRAYLAHRLAWLHVHGEWPAGEVDHRNGNPGDNRIGNLRVVTPQENKHNIHVRPNIRLGSFADPRDASLAYQEAKRRLHPTWEGVVA